MFLEQLLEERWDAIIDFMTYGTDEFGSRLEGLLKATHHYLFLSSARVYAEVEGELLEHSPRLCEVSSDPVFLESAEYAMEKARQEDLLRSASRKNWTIIRPYITYGEKRLQLGTLEKESWLYRALHGRSIVFPKELAARQTTLTYGYDVASIVLNCLVMRAQCWTPYYVGLHL